jgi:hypothetical protein
LTPFLTPMAVLTSEEAIHHVRCVLLHVWRHMPVET